MTCKRVITDKVIVNYTISVEVAADLLNISSSDSSYSPPCKRQLEEKTRCHCCGAVGKHQDMAQEKASVRVPSRDSSAVTTKDSSLCPLLF